MEHKLLVVVSTMMHFISSGNNSIESDKHKAPWDVSQMPSQQGKVVVVTGANAGIGFETAKQLAERHAIVVLACRNEALGKQAQREILQHVKQNRESAPLSDELAKLAPPQVEYMHLDLGSLASIEAFAEAFRVSFSHLDLLVNNAGVAAPAQKRTQDGLESQFGINHVGHFYLTKLLFDLLEKSPSARIVNVSSRSHRRAIMEFDAQGHIVGETGYAISKLANVLFAYELERRLRASCTNNVIAVAAHPGWTNTSMVEKVVTDNVPRALHWPFYGFLWCLPIQSAADGALPTLYAATAEDVQGMEFFGPRYKERYGDPIRELSSPESYNEEKAKKLWALSEELTKCKFVV